MLSKRIDIVPKGAYILATTGWETSFTYEPVEERGGYSYLKSKPYFPYFGRGYCQLTWKGNYDKFGKVLGINLVGRPEMALRPETAWQIMEMGMTDTELGLQDPDFTKYTLEDFLTNTEKDYYNARKIINPKDYRSYAPIAELARKMEECILASIITDDTSIPIRH